MRIYPHIEAVIFDKDGTLFHYADTWGLWCRKVLGVLTNDDLNVAREMAAAVGYDWDADRFEAGSLIVGGAADEINEIWHGYLPQISIAEIDEICMRFIADLPAVPVCDLKAYLSNLKAMGLKLGVATNDFEMGAISQLKSEGILELFDFVAGCDSGFGAKPGPGQILGFCEKMGLSPEKVAMVGDSNHDLEAGRAAKMGLNVAVLTGPAEKTDLLELYDCIFPDLGQLLL